MAKPDKWPEWRVNGNFVGLEHKLLDSSIWRGLSSSGKVLYIEVARQWDKKNGNGCPYYLPFGYKNIKHSMSKRTYMKARKELLKVCLLIQVELAGNNRKGIYSLNRVWDVKVDTIYS